MSPGSHGDSVISPRLCALLVPALPDFDAVARLVTRCCADQGLECRRANADALPTRVTSDLFGLIASALVVVADLTGRHPIVLYGLGVAHGASRNSILLAQSLDDVPFDLRAFPIIQYSNSFAGAEKLVVELSKALSQIAALKQDGNLASTKRGATANATQDPSDIDDPAVLHLVAASARERGDLGHARKYLEQAVALVRNNSGTANDVGNCAIEAEICRFNDLAYLLYELALERDPNHVNNRQCYVSFILDQQQDDEQQLARAAQLLDDLEKEPGRQERTRALRAQYLTTERVRTTMSADEVERVLDSLAAECSFHSLRDAAPTLNILMKAKRTKQVRSLLLALRERITDEEELSTCDRALADTLAVSDDRIDKLRAVQTYEELLRRGGDDTAEIKHNLATLLCVLAPDKDTERVTQLWAEAYAARPEESRIRHAYAGILARGGHLEDAERVIRNALPISVTSTPPTPSGSVQQQGDPQRGGME